MPQGDKVTSDRTISSKVRGSNPGLGCHFPLFPFSPLVIEYGHGEVNVIM